MSVKDPKEGTPIDEAIRRMESVPYSQSVCDGLRIAAEAFGGEDGPEDVTREVRDTLVWMVADMNHRREQTGLDGDVKSPEMRVAEQLVDDLRAGRIECRRLDAGSEVEP